MRIEHEESDWRSVPRRPLYHLLLPGVLILVTQLPTHSLQHLVQVNSVLVPCNLVPQTWTGISDSDLIFNSNTPTLPKLASESSPCSPWSSQPADFLRAPSSYQLPGYMPDCVPVSMLRYPLPRYFGSSRTEELKNLLSSLLAPTIAYLTIWGNPAQSGENASTMRRG